MITVGCRADGFSGGFSGGVFNFSGIHKIKTIALFNGIPPFLGGGGEYVFIFRIKISLVLYICKPSPDHILNQYL